MSAASAGAPDRGAHFDTWREGSAPSGELPVRLHFCPGGRRAALVITDHGDRTRVPTARAIYMGHSRTDHPSYGQRGILPAGVRVTAGVFWSGWEGFDYLDNADFFALMSALHAAGSEVCPHNTSEDIELPADDVRANMRRYAEHFGLKTWIDHYRLPSNFSQQGMDPRAEYYVLDLFRQLGGRAAWSFVDRFVNPPGGSIDLLRPPSGAAYLRSLMSNLAPGLARGGPARARLRARLAWLAQALLGRDAVGNLVVMRQPRGTPTGKSRVAELLRLPLNVARHLALSPLTPVDRTFPLRWDGEACVYWFDTVRVTYVGEAYTPAAVDALVDGNGIHIGHTYLGLLAGRHSDLAFRREGDDFAVRDGFQAFLERIAQRCNAGDLWNPTMAELVEYHEALAAVRLSRDGDCWRLANDNAPAACDVTVRSVVPLRRVAGEHAAHAVDEPSERRVGVEYWYALSLPPGGAVDLEPVQ